MVPRLACWLALLTAAGCETDPQPEAAPVDTSSRAWKEAGAFSKRLASVRKVAEQTKAGKPCPDDEIRTRARMAVARVAMAEHAYLQRYATPTVKPRYRGKDKRWEFLTSDALLAIRGPVELESERAATDAVYRIRELQKETPYLAVVVPAVVEAPKMQGDEFVAGKFEGVLAVFDLTSGDAVCSTSFFTPSTDQVAATEGTSKDQALWNDYSMRIRGALDDAMGQASRVLTLDW